MSSSVASRMRWVPALVVQESDGERAARAGARSLRMEIGDGPLDLVLAFFNAPLLGTVDRIRAVLREEFPGACVAGASASGVIGALSEVDEGPALSLIAGRLPDVRVMPFLLPSEMWSSPPADEETFAMLAPGAKDAEILITVLDPTLPAEPAFQSFEKFAPGVRLVGGYASCGSRPGSNALFLNDWMSRDGGIAIGLTGALRVDSFLSQGVRPVGSALTVTAAERNVIHELDGVRATDRLHEILERLSADDRRLARAGLHIGRPIISGASGTADFVARGVLGHDPEGGSLAIGDVVGVGERIRLLLPDPHAAFEDFSMLLAPQAFDNRPDAALLFACAGRGRKFHGRPNADIGVLQRALGNVPAAGMYCAGEFGPAGAGHRVYGYGAGVAIVRGTASQAE